jgi:hypothetical protein
MDLSQIGNIHIFQVPIDISMLTTIRQQLWANIDRSPDIYNLVAAHLVQCKRIDRQPVTYLSALPHQLLPSNPNSSLQILGNHLLEHLAANHYDAPTAHWQGTVNNQGYLYLQPDDEAIAAWLNQLLNTKNSALNSNSLLLRSDSSITLQYIYTRCNQLLQTTQADILPLSKTAITAATTSEIKLIGAVLDIWDDALIDSISKNTDNQKMLSLSQQLVEQFLEFEKYCCMSAKSNQLSRNFNFSLMAVVQKTVKIILHQYWGIEPHQYW